MLIAMGQATKLGLWIFASKLRELNCPRTAKGNLYPTEKLFKCDKSISAALRNQFTRRTSKGNSLQICNLTDFHYSDQGLNTGRNDGH